MIRDLFLAGSIAVMMFTVGVLPPSASAAPAPAFSADAVSGVHLSSESLKGKTVVLEWINPGCPFVKHFYESREMQGMQREYVGKGVVWITVNSTNSDHKDYRDAEATKQLILDWGIASSYSVIDADGKLGQLFGAKTTPTIFVIDGKGQIAYHGAVDNNPDADDKIPLQNYLKPALDELLAGKPVSLPETQAYGCSVKYR